MAVVAVAGSSCREDKGSGDAEGAARVELPKVNKTFDPDQVVRQIDYVIETRQKIIATTGSFVARGKARREMIAALLQRAQYLGDLSAYDTALAVADEMIAADRERPDRHLHHARVLSALHRFAEASAALDRAEAEGISAKTVELPRIRLLLNRGEPLEALDRLEALDKRQKTLPVVSTLAVTLADLGRREAAARQFSRGVSAPTLIDPLPVAYLWFQQGLMWEREGRRGDARTYYQLALERFPYYPALIGHLAAIEAGAGETDAAIARLRELTRKSDDPEYLGQLAGLLRDAGERGEADRLAARAEARYAALLEKHPLAFSDHAARFYLDVVKKPERALELAAANLENRPVDEAYQLYLDAAHAARKSADPKTCEVAARAVAREHATAYALFAGARALRACGKTAAADGAMKRTKGAKRQR
jgi:tetratricopeptide (TPR) repeat protein